MFLSQVSCFSPPFSPSQSSHYFQLIFLDVWGPAPVLTFNGCPFYLSILHTFTKYLWFFLICAKFDVSTVFLVFITYVKNTFASNVTVIQIDWGREFRSLSLLIKNLDIIHHVSCPYSHEQNGTIERHHHHFVEIDLSLLAHSFVPLKY